MDTVILMLPSSREVEDLLLGADGLLERLSPGSLVIDMGSSEPTSTQELAERAAGRGIEYLDAPVSGGVAKARTGELTIMVGGGDAPFERARPLLERMGATIIHVGPAGAGDAAKALNNLVSAANVAAAAEGIAVATRFGIQPSVMVELLNASTGRSQASEVKYPRHIINHAWDSGFGLDLMVKDLRIASQLAEQLDVPMTVTAAARELAEQTREQFGAGRDHTEVARLVEQRSGTDFTGRTPEDQRPKPENPNQKRK